MKINSHFFNCFSKIIKLIAVAVKLIVSATIDNTNVATNIFHHLFCLIMVAIKAKEYDRYHIKLYQLMLEAIQEFIGQPAFESLRIT